MVAFNNCSSSFLANQDTLPQSLAELSQQEQTEVEELKDEIKNLPYKSVQDFESDLGTPTLCQVDGNFPLRTHYKKNVGPFIGGFDLPDLFNARADLQASQGEKYVLNYTLPPPSVDNYIANRYDHLLFSDAEIKKVLQLLCSKTSDRIVLIQPDKEIFNMADLTQIIKANQNYYQVIHGLVYKSNLFTIVVPPLWNSNNNYSLVINGMYSLNSSLVDKVGSSLYQILKAVRAANQKGAIGVLWNGGGAIGSRTVNNKAYQDLNLFLNMVVPAVNIDPNRVVTFGESRGGVTALNIASHPLVTSVRVGLAYASVPPSDLNLIKKLVTPTVPALLDANDWSTGFVGSWDSRFVMPDGVTTGQSQHLKVLAGTDNAQFIADEINLSAPKKLKKLLKNKTSIVLEIGSHDFIVPFIDQLNLLNIYKNNQVRVHGKINYIGGHLSFQKPMMHMLYSAVLQMESDPDQALSQIHVDPSKTDTFLIDHSLGNSPMPWKIDYNSSPLTLEFPKYMVNHMPAQILVSGVAGKSYAIIAQNSLGDYYLHEFTIPNERILISEFDHLDMPEGDIKLLHLFEVGPSGPINKINFISSVTGKSEEIKINRFKGEGADDPVRLGRAATSKVLEAIYAGQSFVSSGVNYGLLEVGLLPLTQDEIELYKKLKQ